MIYFDLILMFVAPALLACIVHKCLSGRKMLDLKGGLYFVFYFFAIDLSAYCITRIREFGRFDFDNMTSSFKIKFFLLGCIIAVILSIAVCICVEKVVPLERIIIYTQRFVGDLKKYFVYAVKSAGADLHSEVANSYLNWLWWLIEPFCMMLIYTLIFGIVFKASEQFFPIFIFSGLAMWNFFSRGISSSVNIIRGNKGIISKVYLPKFILYLARMFVNGFKMLVSFVIVVAMMIIFRVPPTVNILYLIPILIVFFMLTFGLGTILMHFGVYVNDLSYIVGILLSMLMYFTGTFYSVAKRIPAPFGELLESFNPIAFCIASMRNALLYGQAPSLTLLLLWGIVSIILSIIGIYIIYENENAYVKVI